MMQQKRCLIIDDEDQTAEMERLVSIGAKRNLDISYIQFSVGSQKRGDLLEDNKLSKEKILLAFESECNGGFDLIAFDYQLEDDGITGIDLVKLLAPKRKSAIKLVYSGMRNNILTDILNDYSTNANFNKARQSIQTLFTSGVVDYVERAGIKGYEEVIVDLLSKEKAPIEKIIIKKLKEYGSYKFETVYPVFKGKTLLQIAEEIDRDDNPHSEQFQAEIIEQAIAHMIEMNKQ